MNVTFGYIDRVKDVEEIDDQFLDKAGPERCSARVGDVGVQSSHPEDVGAVMQNVNARKKNKENEDFRATRPYNDTGFFSSGYREPCESHAGDSYVGVVGGRRLGF